MENKNEISKTYKYSQLYKYYQAIPDYEDVEPDVDNLIKIISKYVMIGHFSKDDQLQIRLKKNQISRRDSTPIVQSTSMNIVKEEEKSSQNIKFESSSPEKKSDQMLTNSSITPYRSIKRLRKHQRQSSKTTKKLELSIGSIVRSSNDGGTFISRDLVKAKSSVIVFSKQAQRQKRKELKMMQTLSSKQFNEATNEDKVNIEEEKIINYKTASLKELPEESEKVNNVSQEDNSLQAIDTKSNQNEEISTHSNEYMQKFIIEDYPAKRINNDNFEERRSKHRMPPSGKNAYKRQMMKQRKLSSTSLDHSQLNSVVSSKLNESNFNFKIKVIEPIELTENENKPVKSNTMSPRDDPNESKSTNSFVEDCASPSKSRS